MFVLRDDDPAFERPTVLDAGGIESVVPVDFADAIFAVPAQNTGVMGRLKPVGGRGHRLHAVLVDRVDGRLVGLAAKLPEDVAPIGLDNLQRLLTRRCMTLTGGLRNLRCSGH
jgi:hypothetical protein